ncbi:MAG: RsmB/NOP family class I SAM-dependent RNA methyltransferase [Bacteroidia bacterium]
MKIYKNLVEGVVQSLEKIFTEGRYADKVIEYLFKDQKKWGARDRRFVAETIYDIVRNYRLLKELSGNSGDFYKLIGVYLILHDTALPDWEEFKGIDKKSVQQKWQEAKSKRAVFQSIPDWLDELGQAELGNRWGKELAALNEQAAVVLRANTLKISAPSLQKKLLEDNTDTVLLKEYGDALALKERKNIFSSPLFKQGLFEIQDASSQLVAKFLEPAPGMFVIDACAGAGGKALHIAALMQNKGKLVAMDVEERKLEELKRRAQRASATTVEAKVISSEKVISSLEGKADRLLLDVPCSGLGVLKRNPDAKWKLSLQSIEEVRQKQRNILQNYSRMLKVGGQMVYATCSILPSENQKQVEEFLSANRNYTFVKEKTIYPSEGFDGFYMCLIKREK